MEGHALLVLLAHLLKLGELGSSLDGGAHGQGGRGAACARRTEAGCRRGEHRRGSKGLGSACAGEHAEGEGGGPRALSALRESRQKHGHEGAERQQVLPSS